MRVMYALLLLLMAFASLRAADLRLGFVGADTSHVIAFIKVLNDPKNPDHVPGARIVTAYKGGSADVQSSYTRVDKYAEELRSQWNVEIVADIPTLCSKVDGVLLESVDGRKHLEQARQIIAAGKPMFIDKPMAATLEDSREIARLAKAAGVPWFSTSSLRYGEVATTMKFADARSVITWGPGPTEEHHYLDLSWYAIHAVEMLFTLMGTGVEEVSRVSSPDVDIVTGRWKDGRLGAVQAIRPYADFGAVVVRVIDGKKTEVVQSPPKTKSSYVPMLREIVTFFQTRRAPVPNEETLELFAFMDAAQRSKAAGGAPMKLR